MHRYSKARHVAVVLTATLLGAALVPLGATASAASTSAAKKSSIVFSGAPGTSAPPSTLGSYSMRSFAPDTQAVGEDVDSVTGPTGSVTFSPSLEHDQVGDGWATWSNGYTGDVYSTGSDTVTLTLPAGAKAFYFYAEPDQFMTFSMKATSTDGTTSGPIAVAGQAGAQYFGFYSTGAGSLKTITVTVGVPAGFAVGEFGISSCTDYNSPTQWTTNTVAGYTPGAEPLNVVISACSDVSLENIREGLGNWGEVGTSCLSAEQADVAGAGFVNQQESWRLTGLGLNACAVGNILSLNGTENHLRIWNQPIAGTHGAWFISASYETACVSLLGKMYPGYLFSLPELGLFYKLHLTWHCIDGSQGSIGEDGYDSAAASLVSEIQAAATANNWLVDVQTVQTAPGIGEGANGTGVPYDGTVYVVTVQSGSAA